MPLDGEAEDQKGLCSHSIHDKITQGSLWADALEQKDSDGAIESLWRRRFNEIFWFCTPLGVPGVIWWGALGVQGFAGGFSRIPGGRRDSLGIPRIPLIG